MPFVSTAAATAAAVAAVPGDGASQRWGVDRALAYADSLELDGLGLTSLLPGLSAAAGEAGATPSASPSSSLSSSSLTAATPRSSFSAVAAAAVASLSGSLAVWNLRRLVLSGNALSSLEGVQHCAGLEELIADDNRLTDTRPLARLRRLRVVELAHNRIRELGQLTALPALTQLSLEGNALSSLAGLEQLQSLTALYLARNSLANLTADVRIIASLPRLLILDLAGNPLAQDPEYRLHAVFHLRRVRVLDGSSVDGDVAAARERHQGRLTEDMLRGIVGGDVDLSTLETLNLSSQRLRHVGAITAALCPALRTLILDGNLLTDLSSLRALPHLRVLRLNRNKIVAALAPTLQQHQQLVLAASSGEASGDAAAAYAATAGAGAGPGLGLLASLFPQLEVLELAYNRIALVSAVQPQGLRRLVALGLEGNEISRLEGLSGLPRLQHLVLSRNRIVRLEPGAMAGLPSLRELQIEENGMQRSAE